MGWAYILLLDTRLSEWDSHWGWFNYYNKPLSVWEKNRRSTTGQDLGARIYETQPVFLNRRKKRLKILPKSLVTTRVKYKCWVDPVRSISLSSTWIGPVHKKNRRVNGAGPLSIWAVEWMVQNKCADRLSNKRFRHQVDQRKNREKQTPFIHWLRNLHPAPESTPAFLILACFDHESTLPRPLGDDHLKLRLDELQNCLQVWATHFNLPVWCLFSSARGWKAGVQEGVPDLRLREFCLDTSERGALFLCFYKRSQWERDRRLSITLLIPLLYSQQHRLLLELFSTWKWLTKSGCSYDTVSSGDNRPLKAVNFTWVPVWAQQKGSSLPTHGDERSSARGC